MDCISLHNYSLLLIFKYELYWKVSSRDSKLWQSMCFWWKADHTYQKVWMRPFYEIEKPKQDTSLNRRPKQLDQSFIQKTLLSLSHWITMYLSSLEDKAANIIKHWLELWKEKNRSKEGNINLFETSNVNNVFFQANKNCTHTDLLYGHL